MNTNDIINMDTTNDMNNDNTFNNQLTVPQTISFMDKMKIKMNYYWNFYRIQTILIILIIIAVICVIFYFINKKEHFVKFPFFNGTVVSNQSLNNKS